MEDERSEMAGVIVLPWQSFIALRQLLDEAAVELHRQEVEAKHRYSQDLRGLPIARPAQLPERLVLAHRELLAQLEMPPGHPAYSEAERAEIISRPMPWAPGERLMQPAIDLRSTLSVDERAPWPVER